MAMMKRVSIEAKGEEKELIDTPEKLALDKLIKNIEEQEEYMITIAMIVKEMYNNRREEIKNCTCSTHTCTSKIEGLECKEKIRKSENFCENYEEERIGLERAGVRLPPGTDPRNLSNELKWSICTFR